MNKNLFTGVFAVATIGFAALVGLVMLSAIEEDYEMEHYTGNSPKRVMPGDKVQWDSDGTLMFQEPKEVINIEKSDLGTFVFVKDATCGIPIDQVIFA